MDIIKSYKRYIVENKNLVLLAIFLAAIIRICFYWISDQSSIQQGIKGYLWVSQMDTFLSNNIISISISFVFTLAIVFYLSYLNTKHKLIRNRTYLIYVIPVLALSYHPVFIYMNPQYISLIFIILCLDNLFDTYQQDSPVGKAYNIGFYLAFASMFSFATLMYLPVFWIGFGIMRNFRLKTTITSLLGVATVYWLALCYYVWVQDLSTFTLPFTQLYPIFREFWLNISLLKLIEIIIPIILLSICFINYLSSSFYDKIQTRIYIYIFFLFSAFSILASIFINYDQILNIYMLSVSLSVLLAHYFTLVLVKWKVSLFYVLAFFYLFICIYYFFYKLIITDIAA